jgi:hypothetical protein
MNDPVTIHQLGYFGNIWVRQNVVEKSGDFVPGHKHHFDHVSLLTKGKVKEEFKMVIADEIDFDDI